MRRADVQYELGINKYKQMEGYKNIKRKTWIKTSAVKLVTILIIGILLGRVNLLLNQLDSHGIAPMGIAYLMAISTKENKIDILISAIGIAIGYLTINSMLTDGYAYLIAVALMTIYYAFIASYKRRKKELIGFIIISSSFLIYGVTASKYELGVDIIICLLQTMVVMLYTIL